MLKQFNRNLITALLLMLSATTLGVVGYMLIEGHGFIDALYMTVITLATVGYGEVQPLTDVGKLFTIFLIVSTIGIFTYTISMVSSYLVDGRFRHVYHHYRFSKKVRKMKNHVIVCGYGRNGRKVAEEMRKHGVPYIVIDNKAEAHEEPENGGLVLTGNATDDKILLQANLEEARALISTLPHDADNVFVVLTARSVRADLVIISRASQEASVSKLKRAGADHVVMPDKIGGFQMASLVIRPDVTEFLDILTNQVVPTFQIGEFGCEELCRKFQTFSVGELHARLTTGAIIIGLKNAAGEYVINPAPAIQLTSTCKLLAIGTSEQLAELGGLLHKITPS